MTAPAGRDGLPVAPTPQPAVVPGDRVELSPADVFGVSDPVLLIVREVGADLATVHLEWVRIAGTQVMADGTAAADRELLVRVAALASAVRPVGWLP